MRSDIILKGKSNWGNNVGHIMERRLVGRTNKTWQMETISLKSSFIHKIKNNNDDDDNPRVWRERKQFVSSLSVEKTRRTPGGSDGAVVTSLECRHQQRPLSGVKTPPPPPPHSSLPPSTILYLCLQEEGGAMGHENAIGTAVWTLRSRKLNTGFHHTLDRKLLGVWREAWTKTRGSVGGKTKKTTEQLGSSAVTESCGS